MSSATVDSIVTTDLAPYPSLCCFRFIFAKDPSHLVSEQIMGKRKSVFAVEFRNLGLCVTRGRSVRLGFSVLRQLDANS